MNTIRIFIASSSELEQDRKAFREFLSVENDRLHKKGMYLELVQWEHFLDAVSQTSLQDEYNKQLVQCAIVVCLFFSKAGKYTRQEFEAALQHFRAHNSPLIYTYFKSGAPAADPADVQAMDLADFKQRLTEIGHFYTVYQDTTDLNLQFRKQLDKLEDQGLPALQQQVKDETLQAVTNYFTKNVVSGSTITAARDVTIGDTSNTAATSGNNNIVIQGVSDSSITVNVNGQSQEISNKLDTLMALLEKQGARTFQSANRLYNTDTITAANFSFLLGRAGTDKKLPEELAQNLVGDGNNWTESLRQELVKKHGISVGNQPWNVFQHYGWLIETFLQKMGTAAGQEKTLRRLSFMAEAYQASLRYMCYVQMAQILQMDAKPGAGIITDFLLMEGDKYLDFDYTSLLLTSTGFLKDAGFIKEISAFAAELSDPESSVYGTALYLEEYRRKLISNEITEAPDTLNNLLDEYLTALVFWLRKIAFLSRYRLVSIKDIDLNYCVGTTKNFVHLYGELHGIYSEGPGDDYISKSVEDFFTYNKSVLLLNGKDVDACMNEIRNPSMFLSLSPLVIDQSVYAGKPTQTPEIFYYSGYTKSKRRYGFAQFKNELPFSGRDAIASNKMLLVQEQNNNQPRLDELFEQLEKVFNPLKSNPR